MLTVNFQIIITFVNSIKLGEEINHDMLYTMPFTKHITELYVLFPSYL